MKKLFNEFKEFAVRGNAMSLAVGVIIGGAFQNIVNSLVNDIITPILSLAGNTDFSRLSLRIGKARLNYGSFITSVINFLIMAIIIFFMVKGINALTSGIDKMMNKGKGDAEVKPTTKICPYCKSEINIEATKCPHCTSTLN